MRNSFCWPSVLTSLPKSPASKFMTPEERQRKFDGPLTERQQRGLVPIVKNARSCGVCGSAADRYIHTFECQTNPGHVGDLIVGIFSDLTPPNL